MLGDALSGIPLGDLTALGEVGNIMAVELNLPSGFTHNYGKDAMFGPIYRALSGKMSEKEVEKSRVQRLLPLFELQSENLFYKDKLCVPRSYVKDILEIAHDSCVSGHFAFSKTLKRLQGFHWPNKT